MKLSQFNFKLPKEQVALYPHKARRVVKTASGERVFEVTRRDESRLMVLHKKSETIEMYKKDEEGKDMVDADGNPVYLQFKDIVNYFTEGDTFVFNDTKVFPARLYGTKEKTDAKIEVFLLRELNPEMRLWDVLVEPARKIRIGNKLFFDDSQAYANGMYFLTHLKTPLLVGNLDSDMARPLDDAISSAFGTRHDAL